MPFIIVVDNHKDSEESSSSSSSSRLCSLDLQKMAVEQLVDSLRRQFAQQQHQCVPIECLFMLASSLGDRSCVKSLYGEPPAIFERALKHMTASSVENDLSFSLSHVFSIANKYRMRNQTDRLGFGFVPAVSEPTVVIVVTDGSYISTGRTVSLNTGSASTGAEFYTDAYRWDQRVVSVVVGQSQTAGGMNVTTESPNSLCPPDLAAISHATGGEVVSCRGVKEIVSSMKALALRIGYVSFTEDLHHHHL